MTKMKKSKRPKWCISTISFQWAGLFRWFAARFRERVGGRGRKGKREGGGREGGRWEREVGEGISETETERGGGKGREKERERD